MGEALTLLAASPGSEGSDATGPARPDAETCPAKPSTRHKLISQRSHTEPPSKGGCLGQCLDRFTIRLVYRSRPARAFKSPTAPFFAHLWIESAAATTLQLGGNRPIPDFIFIRPIARPASPCGQTADSSTAMAARSGLSPQATFRPRRVIKPRGAAHSTLKAIRLDRSARIRPATRSAPTTAATRPPPGDQPKRGRPTQIVWRPPRQRGK